MHKLNFPQYDFRIQKLNNNFQIFDKIRKKFVALTPEEWVRQNMIEYLIHEKKYKTGLLSIEMPLVLNTMQRRCDIVVFNNEAKPLMIVELKAPGVKITQKVFDQISRYNMNMKVNYLLVSNGLQHYCCKMDYKNEKYFFLKEIPEYGEL